MNRKEKSQVIDRITEKLQSGSAVLVDYQGMNVAQATDLRRKSRETGVEFIVAKNTLTRMAADRAGVSGLNEYLVGPTAIAFSEDPVASAKLMAEFADLVESFDLKAGLLDSETILGESDVIALSKLPSRDQLIAQIVGGISSPLTGFVTVLNNTIQGLVVALGQISEQKEQQS